MLTGSPPRALAAAAVLLALDWTLVAVGPQLSGTGPYGPRVLAAALLVAALRRGDLGLRLGPLGPDLAHTGRVLAVCAAVGLVLAGALVLWARASGAEVSPRPRNVASLERLGPWLLLACVQAPLFEELIYRAWIQRELRDALGPRRAIVLSGLVFWMHHWWMAGGVTPPNQLIGGLVIAWSFERTRSLTTPVLLHAAGNLALALLDVVLLTWPEWAAGLLGR